MLFFSIRYNIYLKKGFFGRGGGEIFHLFRISLIILSFLNVYPIFLNILFHGWGIPFIFSGGGGEMPWGLSVSILVDIPL